MRILTTTALLVFVLVAGSACTNETASTTAGTQESKQETATPELGSVVTTASGLQYQVLQEGTGASPTESDNVTVHYRGTLTDGTEFDSSYKRGQPATFPLNRVIPGWTEGLQLMKEGAKYRFTIPPKLGYGARGMPPQIPPDATLIFDVELIKVG